MSERVGFAILLGGAAIVLLGYLWLVRRGFGTSFLWGIGLFLIPPFALRYIYLYFRRSARPLVVMILGGLVMASPVVVNRLMPENREAVTEDKEGEKRGTLTGATETEVVKYLRENRDVAVLQMAERADVTDTVILEEIKEMPNLRELDLNGTPITDASLKILAAMPRLKSLRIARTKVTPEGVEQHILSSTTIEEIDVTGLGVPSKKLREWKNADPMNRKYVTGPAVSK